MRALYYATMLALLAAGVSCRPREEKEQPFYIGIWQGTYKDKPLSIEFRKDGRAILVYGGEDAIPIATYSINLQKEPPHLDVKLRKPWLESFSTLIEQTAPDTIRIEDFKDGAPRPDAFTSDAMVLRRAESHVLQRRAKSAEERDRKLQHVLTMDIILFGGEEQEELFAICEAVFRYQFEHNALAAQQNAAAYFLSIDQRDPPTEFMNRFGGHSPPVKPRSEFHERKGLLFRIETLVWLDKASIEVGGVTIGVSRNTYVLRRRNGTWKVIKRKPGVIW